MKHTLVFSRSVSTIFCAIVGLVVVASTPLVAQDYKFTISTAQSWTDTGVDLQTGDMIAITSAADHRSGAASCDPAGVATASSSQNLPVATALPGALIARMQEGGTPTLVGASQQLRVPQAGHLFLGINAEGTPPCHGAFAVKVHITSAGGTQLQSDSPEPAAAESLAGKASTKSTTAAQPATSAAQSNNTGGEKDVKDIKGALSTAAQTWLTGQFGTGTAANAPASTSSSAAAGNTPSAAVATAQTLKLSNAALDSQLRRQIDTLPRRVNDQFQHQGDMVNFVIVGNLQKVQDVLTAADWHAADRDLKESVLKAALETYQKKAYLAMPMSELYLFGRVQDYGYEQAEPYAVVASRHHFRIWKAPFEWNGQDVWAGAGTHDIGFEKDQRNGSVTHKIDPAVDGERDNIGATLQKTDKVKTLTYYLPPDPVQDARNATGGGYHSDGRILVVLLQ
jgi:LssY C-terminus